MAAVSAMEEPRSAFRHIPRWRAAPPPPPPRYDLGPFFAPPPLCYMAQAPYAGGMARGWPSSGAFQQVLKGVHKRGRRGGKKQKNNRKGCAPTPRTVPRAPYNSSSFLASAHGHYTPASLRSHGAYHAVTPNPHGNMWVNSAPPVLDMEEMQRVKAAGLDLFPAGSQDALLQAVGLQPRDFGDEDEDLLGWSDSSEDEEGDSGPEEEQHNNQQQQEYGGEGHCSNALLQDEQQRLRRQVQSQSAYITELQERNLDLEEKLYVMEREVKALRAQVAGEADAASAEGRSGSSSDDDMEAAGVRRPAAEGQGEQQHERPGGADGALGLEEQ